MPRRSGGGHHTTHQKGRKQRRGMPPKKKTGGEKGSKYARKCDLRGRPAKSQVVVKVDDRAEVQLTAVDHFARR